MKNVLLFLFILFVVIFSQASGDIIRGTITDAHNSAPLKEVQISRQETPGIYVVSAADGTYELNTALSGVIPESRPLSWTGFSGPVTILVRDVQGRLIGDFGPHVAEGHFKSVFAEYPRGIYFISLERSEELSHCRIIKVNNATMIIGQLSSRTGSAALSKRNALAAVNILVYTKIGYQNQTRTVEGGQDNVDVQMQRVPEGCPNGVVEEGEVCDSDTDLCKYLAPLSYASGDAVCNAECSGYTVDACIEHPVVETEGMAAEIQRGAGITGGAHYAILQLVQPGMTEGDIHDIINSAYKEGGSSSNCFRHITGSGPHSLDLHYTGTDGTLQDGDVLLVDIGAKSNGFCSDITRTYPVSGVFTERQAEVYQLVLDAQRSVAAEMRPGVHSLWDLLDMVEDVYRQSPLRADGRTMDNFLPHGVSHYIGTRVHGDDLGLDEDAPAEIGQVFTIEPGIYLESEGFGIRIEDDFILTENGAVNIFPNTPVEIEDIEALMARRALGPLPPRRKRAVQQTPPDIPERGHMDF